MKWFSLGLWLVFSACSVVKEEIRLGAKWEKLSENNTLARRNFGTVVLDDKIIIVAGFIWKDTREELANDVWISEDEGKSWSQVKSNTESPTETFTKRQKFGLATIGNVIYMVGGYSDTGSHLNDVWKSEDLGKTWVLIKENAEFSPRYGHKLVAIGNDLYVIGGTDGRIYYNEVWKSSDLGNTWSEVNMIPFKPREGFGAINYKNEILLIGGDNANILTDTWKSESSVKKWYKEPNIPFELYEQELVEVAGDLFVVEQDHVWKSIDEGQTWIKVLFEAPFEERTGYGLVNIRRKLILFGGRNPNTGKYLNDVWESKY